LFLDASGYVPNAAQQSDRAVRSIRILTGPIPAALLCAGIVFTLIYPITRERHAQVRRELAERRAARSGEEAA
jgi:Na+/melibiose symporter-like transporter